MIEQPTRKVGRWLQAKDTVHLVSIILGIILAISTVVGGIMTLGAKLAERDFVTVTLMKEREIELIKKFETRITNSEALAVQREIVLTQRIEIIAKDQEDANIRMQASIDRIYNLLLQGRR